MRLGWVEAKERNWLSGDFFVEVSPRNTRRHNAFPGDTGHLSGLALLGCFGPSVPRVLTERRSFQATKRRLLTTLEREGEGGYECMRVSINI